MHKKRLLLAQLILFSLCILKPAASAQCPTPPAQPNNLSTWVNCRVFKIIQARTSQRQNTRQTETPSISDSSTSLVDQSSASDLIGAAINLVGLNNSDGNNTDRSFSFTASGYSLLAAFSNHDPLDPVFYLANSGVRKFWFTLGQELPDKDDSSAVTESAKIVGFKALIVDKRDVGKRDLTNLSNAVARSAPNFLQTAELIGDYLYAALASKLQSSSGRFQQRKIESGNEFLATMSLLSESQLRDIDEIIITHIGPEIELNDAIRTEVENIRHGSQLSISIQSKFRKEGVDEYKAELVYDKGMLPRMNLSLNGAFEYLNSKTIGGDLRGKCLWAVAISTHARKPVTRQKPRLF